MNFPFKSPSRFKIHIPASVGLLALLASCGGGGSEGSSTGTLAPPGGNHPVGGPIPPAPVPPSLGLMWHVATYEAEAGQLSGTAVVLGASDQSDRTVGDLAGEASHRQAVMLTGASDSVSWTTLAGEAGTNAIVIRYSIPDAASGGGAPGSLVLAISDSHGNLRAEPQLSLTSRYAWLYGGPADGTKLYNVPADAASYATASTPTHLYDEIQLKLGIALNPGDTITLARTSATTAPAITIDFIELETVPRALSQPTGYLSITDTQCGAIASDLRHTGSVFDGADDSSYGSDFNPVIGTNPFNPTSFGIKEKDYYSTDPGNDILQDTSPNAATSGLSMFALADHNFQSIQTCVQLVLAAGSRYLGVWIPPGRFYARGLLQLPNAITIQGAGMWYSKFVSVDSAPPVSVTHNGVTGIASTSGNLVFSSQSGGASHVVLSNFAIFGNVTQRDVIDSVIPMGIHGEFTNSIFDNIWVEHEFIGINTNLSSSGVQISNSRVRNTFADGIDFYGSTSNSTVTHSQSRSTGDDGFALWSQGTTAAAVSQSNTVTNSVAELQWYGNGFAIYGGKGSSVMQSSAADILNYPCLQISTQFVPATVPQSSPMSASASHLDFERCGGNGFSQQFGALLIGTDLLNINGISIDHIAIANPTFKGIDIRPIPAPASHTVTATFANVDLSNVTVSEAPLCAAVNAYAGGTAQFNNVCSCTSATSTPVTCGLTNASPTTFSVNPNTCSALSCQPD